MGMFARSYQVPDLGAFSIMEKAKDQGYDNVVFVGLITFPQESNPRPHHRDEINLATKLKTIPWEGPYLVNLEFITVGVKHFIPGY